MLKKVILPTKPCRTNVKKSIKVLNKAPKEVAADRCFYSGKNEKEIQALNVKHVAIPKPSKKNEIRESMNASTGLKH